MFLEVLGLSKLITSVLVLWQTAYLRFSLPKHIFKEVLGLPELIICVLVLGRLPICVFSAPNIVFTVCWACRS